jgi:hypothetical protein
VYRRKCWTEYAWVCTPSGCWRVPYEKCIVYPELSEFQRV